jgi:hypothetical protein
MAPEIVEGTQQIAETVSAYILREVFPAYLQLAVNLRLDMGNGIPMPGQCS